MSDLISRQAAIDAIDDVLVEDEQYKVWFKLAIENIPSVQPEIIRCKDCKSFEKYTVICTNKKSCLFSTREDFGCIFAERKEDE